MANACPIPTAAERAAGTILCAIEQDLVGEVSAALGKAAQRARTEFAAAGVELPPPGAEYFVAMVHQHLYCKLCGADPKTFAGGRANIAMTLIHNAENIARHYWGAKIEARSKS